MANFYLGNASSLASNMGSIFRGGSNGTPAPYMPGPTQGTTNPVAQPPSHVVGTQPIPGQNSQQNQLKKPGQVTGSTSTPYGVGYDPLAAQAVRPTSFGNMDASYGQNLASAIGSSFQRPQANQALQFNPYGNLTDANVPYPNNGAGNAPIGGIPQTMLQWAQTSGFNQLFPQITNSAGQQQWGGQVGVNAQGNPIYD